jgi:hypothetical protein
MTPGNAWRGIVERELLSPDIVAGTGFGKSEGLRISGKIFAMFVNDEPVVRLSRSRADEIVAAGRGCPGQTEAVYRWLIAASPASI